MDCPPTKISLLKWPQAGNLQLFAKLPQIINLKELPPKLTQKSLSKSYPKYQSQKLEKTLLSEISVGREESCIYAKTIAWDRFHLVGLANAEIGEKAGMLYSTMHSVNTNKWNLMLPTCCSSFVDATPEENSGILKMMMKT